VYGTEFLQSGMRGRVRDAAHEFKMVGSPSAWPLLSTLRHPCSGLIHILARMVLLEMFGKLDLSSIGPFLFSDSLGRERFYFEEALRTTIDRISNLDDVGLIHTTQSSHYLPHRANPVDFKLHHYPQRDAQSRWRRCL
jgi:hypothetical protein